MLLCQQFTIPLLVACCDNSGFNGGPELEKVVVRCAAYHKMFTAAAKLTVPLVAVVLRKCYGLGCTSFIRRN